MKWTVKLTYMVGQEKHEAEANFLGATASEAIGQTIDAVKAETPGAAIVKAEAVPALVGAVVVRNKTGSRAEVKQ